MTVNRRLQTIPSKVAPRVRDPPTASNAGNGAARPNGRIFSPRLGAAKTAFINLAAHELRTPLAPMKADLALLSAAPRAQLGTEQRRSVDRLHRNLSRMSKLVEDLLQVARVQTGDIQLQPSRVDLGRLVRETTNAFEVAARNAGVSLRFTGPSRLMAVADVAHMERVTFNLVSNAIKFTPPNGRVHVEVRSDGDDVVVAVHDTGIGFRASDASKLFEAFAQLRPEQAVRAKGAGLGLYTCRKLVELQGGTLRAHSRGPGQGSTFEFRIPKVPTF